MRRRIFLFHTLTLLVALTILLAVSGGVVHYIMGFYQRPAILATPLLTSQVQTVLADWPDGAVDFRPLDRALKELEFFLVVEREGRIVYPAEGLDQFQTDMYRRASAQTVWPEEGTLNVQSEGTVLIGRQCGDAALVAMVAPKLPAVLGRPRPQNEAATLSLLVSGTAAIGVIVVCSLAFTQYQVKRIMRPVQALAGAARRVEEGDLSTPVGYGGQDEFSAVCAAFDHMQQHLLREREKNAAYERARTDLVAGISHDLRTPLTSVKGYIKGLRDGVANTPEKQGQYLEVAYRKACDMERLLQRLFYFSKLETGSLPLFPVHTDLMEFVRRFARDTGQELEPLGGRVELRGAPAAHPVVLDEEQMLRALSNLKDNALRYAMARPLVLTLTVWRQRDRECLRFADNGRGVSQGQLPHLFEQFWRGDEARSSGDGEGSGLGLYIVKYIVQAHGGTVEARNDGGLVFDITLPCEEEAP